VKRLTVIIGFFLLLFIALSMVLSSRAMAYDPKKDLVSAIDLKPTGLIMKKALSEDATAKEGSPSREQSVPVSDGPSPYIDCSTPSHQDPTKETTKDFRAVVGFHFVLK